MKIALIPQTNAPILDWLGGQSSPHSGVQPNLNPFLNSLNPDVFLCPHDLFDLRANLPYLRSLLAVADRDFLLVSNRGDHPFHLCHPRLISIQTAVEIGSRCRKHSTVIVPYNVKSSNFLEIRRHSSDPTISFVGYVPQVSIRGIVRTFRKWPPHPIKANGALVRRFGTEIVKKQKSHFVIVRENYSATHKAAREFPNRRSEFINSLRHSDFVFSPRGYGNASQRFYEALAWGRIPIIPNTDIKFPRILGPKLGNYFIMTAPNSKNLSNVMNEFWRNLNQETYASLQKEIFDFFRDEISQDNYIFKMFSGNVNRMLQTYSLV